MGINLGAFASPILCGWLVDNTRGRYHSGFALAGFGMTLALVTYLIGLRWVVELDQKSGSPLSEESKSRAEESGPEAPMAESLLNRWAPGLLGMLGCILGVGSPLLALAAWISWDTVLALELAAICALVVAGIAHAVRQKARDQVLAILLLAAFAILFWAGSGQSGNAINLWAEQNTNRYLTQPAPEVDLYPETAVMDESGEEPASSPGWWERLGNMFRRLPAKETGEPQGWKEWWGSCWNPVPTAWFQSINPLLIMLLAPLMAILWTWLGRRGLNPSIPTKMALGLLLMALAFGLMAGGAVREAVQTSVPYRGASLPPSLVVNAQRQLCRAQALGDPLPYAAGCLYCDLSSKKIWVIGVLPDLVRDEIVGDTAPADFVAKIEELRKRTEEAGAGSPGWRIMIPLDSVPPGLDLRFAGLGKPAGNKEISFSPGDRLLTSRIVLEEKDMRGLKVAAGDPDLRSSLDDLMIKSNSHRISPTWLLGFFLLATLGELCLSPIGLSMVSQLAPPRFATMLMSVWLLTFSFGNFLGGAWGERWGVWAPVSYFVTAAIVLGTGTLVLVCLIGQIRKLMHGADR